MADLVTVKGDKVKHGGNIIDPGQNFIYINGTAINIDGAEISTHSLSKIITHTKKHVKGGKQGYILIKNKKVCIKGDKTDCGSNVESGQQNLVYIS